MSSDNFNVNAQNSVVVGGGVDGVVQNVHGDRAQASANTVRDVAGQGSIADLIKYLREQIDVARPDLENAGRCDEAIEAIEAGAADPKRHRFSILGALQVLRTAALTVTSLAGSVTALQHAFDKFW